LLAAVTSELRTRGWGVEHVLLRDKEIGPCAGDFFCWIRTPGTCMLDDDNRTIAAAMTSSDLLVYLTPVTFGGYSSALKSMVDHQIQNISPFFAKVEGETHHQKRYETYPDLLAVGWQDEPDAQAEQVFRHLVQRNALNWRAERSASQVVLASQTGEELQALVQAGLGDLTSRAGNEPVTLPDAGDHPAREEQDSGGGAPKVRNALLLVGSPKTKKSSSYLLGEYLFHKFAEQSIETETVFVHNAVRSPDKMDALLEAVDRADLAVLAFPLYVDSLPAPVIEALEAIALHRRGRAGSPAQRFAAIANCGFPEAFHNATALAICETFARQAGYAWAGWLSLGGGGGMGATAPLAEAGGRAAALMKPLDLAAEALARGESMPEEAQALLAKPFAPAWLYRLLGNWGWPQQAKRWGAQKLLRQKPYTMDTPS
jgi:multimeric flavodoxin WrbA